MSKNASKEEVLGELHRVVAKSLIEDLSDTSEDSVEVRRKARQDAIKFLKDNSINCELVAGDVDAILNGATTDDMLPDELMGSLKLVGNC